MSMDKEDVEFLMNAYICINDVNKRKEWRCKEENLSRLIELHEKQGSDVVDAKTQEIKGVLNVEQSKCNARQNVQASQLA